MTRFLLCKRVHRKHMGASRTSGFMQTRSYRIYCKKRKHCRPDLWPLTYVYVTLSEEIRLTLQQRADEEQWHHFPACSDINLSRNSTAQTGTFCAMSGTFHKSKGQKRREEERRAKKISKQARHTRARKHTGTHTTEGGRAGRPHVCMMRLFIMGQLVPP